MKRILLALLVFVSVVLLSESARPQSQVATGIIRADSHGDILLEEPAYLGKFLLPAGTYRVHSHGSGPKQEIHFEQEVTITEVHPESSSVTVYSEKGRVNCTAEKLPRKSGETILHYVEENGVVRILSVEIKGESEIHGF